ncbi:facilitated trehalose transporter Tret1-like [Neodiprion pinetum]|uniref:facilitated trehalose transporter Tret1-like n=1 Tax=Neodiprion pinetum TaxID=441929 RepID=UPI001EDEB5B2|nr:facilitated trehalose transporter Tret1-like [Neodiprion pinetum]
MVFGFSQSSLTGILWLQWIGGLAAMTMMFVIGLTIGWASPYLAQFSSGESPFPASAVESSWIVLIYQLGRPLGAVLGFLCNQYFGSKTTMISTGCGLLVSWILMIAANSVTWIYVARFISGAGAELVGISFPLYLGEISSPNLRGTMIAMTTNGLTLGLLAGNTMGANVSMRIFSCISLVPTAVFTITFALLPQSPYHLMSRNKVMDAEKAILKYNPKADISVEVDSIKRFVASSNKATFFSRLREFNILRNKKSGLMIIALNFFAQSSGVNVFTAYSEIIVTRGMVTVISPATMVIITTGVGVLAGFSMMNFSDKFGRRKIWVSSSCGLFVSMAVLGAHFYLLTDGFDSRSLQWLPIFSMKLFAVCYNLGLLSIPHILVGELFVANIRGLAALISCLSAAIFGFVSIEMYQLLSDFVDEGYVYWIYAILMLVSTIFGMLVIPDTKRMTLIEIQNSMMKK